MFDQSYQIHFLMSNDSYREPFHRVHLYKFRAKSKLIYIVRLEEFDHSFFSVKYYLKKLSHSTKKYEMLTSCYEASRIINTCLKVMEDVLDKYPTASFGFTGAPIEREDTTDKPTKRYRIYQQIMQNFFPPDSFHHYPLAAKNAYFLINAKNQSPKLVLDYITQLLRESYSF